MLLIRVSNIKGFRTVEKGWVLVAACQGLEMEAANTVLCVWQASLGAFKVHLNPWSLEPDSTWLTRLALVLVLHNETVLQPHCKAGPLAV